MKKIFSRLAVISALMLACITVVPRSQVGAQAGASQLTPRGEVRVNGNALSNSMAIADGSRITTGKTGYAILSIAEVGQFYIGNGSDLTLKTTNGRVKIDIVSGVIRAVKTSGMPVQITSNQCVRVDVVKGKVGIFTGPDSTAPMVESIAESEVKDYLEGGFIRVDSMEGNDFRVAVFDCVLGAAPALPPVIVPIGAVPAPVLASVVAAAAGAAIVPIVTTGKTPVSPARP
jgi:hypothetical protein